MSWDIEDRLALARRMGYACGDHADHPDRPGAWFTKPVRNPAGMGVGARANAYGVGQGWQHPLNESDMWMPKFRGLHVSVDFQRRRGGWRQGLTVRCDYDTALGRPRRWCIEARTCDVPAPLRRIDAEWLNVEFIGGGLIEAHARRNADFDRAPARATQAVVVWADQRRPATTVEDFDDADGQLAVPRLGFVYR